MKVIVAKVKHFRFLWSAFQHIISVLEETYFKNEHVRTTNAIGLIQMNDIGSYILSQNSNLIIMQL